MKVNLKGKNAFVGGSSQGLGKAIAMKLAQCGASVTLIARNEDKLKSVLKELPTLDNQHHQYLIVDYYNFKNYEKIIADYFQTNSVDILVNNTNGPKGSNILNLSVTDYQEAFDLLFKTAVFNTSQALKYMKNNKFGRIINATSITVREPLPQLALSNSIRSALVLWAKTLATEIAPYGITINNILTGIFDTERIVQLNRHRAKSLDISYEKVKQSQLDAIPMKRLGNPSEFADLVAFLASSSASYITGTNIPIDGGLLKSI